MNIKEVLGVRESYQVPTALMDVLKDPEKRQMLVEQYRTEYPDLSHEHFREYFMEEQANRKGDKQDYTPNEIGDIIAGIIGKRENVLDIAGGIGGLTIREWSDNHDGTYTVEEISSASLPFLIFNFLVRKMHAYVVYGDSLNRLAKDVYEINGDSLTIMKKDAETQEKFNLRGWVDEL